jgi:hypothetical protein
VVSRLYPVAIKTTANSLNGKLAFDGNEDTVFSTQMKPGTPPTWAWLRADLGKVTELRSLRWLVNEAGAADDFKVQVSNDGLAWRLAAAPTADVPGEWQTLSLNTSARFVRLYWRNPQLDAQLGHVAEVQIFGIANDDPVMLAPTSASVMKATPSMVVSTAVSPLGERIAVKTTRRSSNSPIDSSRLAIDGKTSTAWATSMSVAPSVGWLYFDLGSVQQIGRIRWQFQRTDCADLYRIQVSNDATNWQTLVTHVNPKKANEWQTLLTETEARYVRFIFLNKNADANIGYLSEVRFYRS